MNREQAHRLWREFVNPDFIGLLETFDFGRCYVRSEGTKLTDHAGVEYTDFLSGFGVHNVGHNHPKVVAALRSVLDAKAASMLNVDAPGSAGLLAEQLTRATHASLCRTVFANAGAEAVEIALRATRTATGRNVVLACENAYHGLTAGALALTDLRKHSRSAPPVSADVVRVPFDDSAALHEACERHRPAAFIVEPIQGEGGIRVAPSGYLSDAADICRRAGCLLVMDEIQTGLGRTGRMCATDFSRVQPDILLVGKALSGGLVPAAAAMLTDGVWKRAFSGPDRCTLTHSTFAGNALAMAAGLAVLQVIEEEHLCESARNAGEALLAGLRALAQKHAIIREVRGTGLLIGVEFQPPAGLAVQAVPKWARESLFAQVITVLLLREHKFLTQPCSLDGKVFRIEPPLNIARGEIAQFLDAFDRTLAACPSHGAAVMAAFRKKILGREL